MLQVKDMDKATKDFYKECAEREGKTLQQWWEESIKEWEGL